MQYSTNLEPCYYNFFHFYTDSIPSGRRGMLGKIICRGPGSEIFNAFQFAFIVVPIFAHREARAIAVHAHNKGIRVLCSALLYPELTANNRTLACFQCALAHWNFARRYVIVICKKLYHPISPAAGQTLMFLCWKEIVVSSIALARRYAPDADKARSFRFINHGWLYVTRNRCVGGNEQILLGLLTSTCKQDYIGQTTDLQTIRV